MRGTINQHIEKWNLKTSEYLKKDEHVAKFVVSLLAVLYGASEVAYQVGEFIGEFVGLVVQIGF